MSAPGTILATAKQHGFAKALYSPVKELRRRGHTIKVLATGNSNEASGFGDIPFQHIEAGVSAIDYGAQLQGVDVLLVGLSGSDSPDGSFIQAAHAAKIHSIGVNMQDGNYRVKMGESFATVPDTIAMMNTPCIARAQEQITGLMGEEVARRCRVVGWTIFDSYASIRDSYTPEKDLTLRDSLQQQGITLPERMVSYYTQHLLTPHDPAWLPYEQKVTQHLFAAASDLQLKLVVKPHPREDTLFLERLVARHGFTFVPAKACSTPDLIMASAAVVAGRSTCLTEACLLDRNTAGILPEVQDLIPYPAASFNAIPYAPEWNDIPKVLSVVASSEVLALNLLRDLRQKFSVDGKAGFRLANIVEEAISR